MFLRFHPDYSRARKQVLRCMVLDDYGKRAFKGVDENLILLNLNSLSSQKSVENKNRYPFSLVIIIGHEAQFDKNVCKFSFSTL